MIRIWRLTIVDYLLWHLWMCPFSFFIFRFRCCFVSLGKFNIWFLYIFFDSVFVIFYYPSLVNPVKSTNWHKERFIWGIFFLFFHLFQCSRFFFSIATNKRKEDTDNDVFVCCCCCCCYSFIQLKGHSKLSMCSLDQHNFSFLFFFE